MVWSSGLGKRALTSDAGADDLGHDGAVARLLRVHLEVDRLVDPDAVGLEAPPAGVDLAREAGGGHLDAERAEHVKE